MDFLDPKKKRAHLKRLYLGYALMAVVLAFGTVILVFAAYGYDIDRNTGNVILNGLIIADAKPETARIVVNGKDQGATSNRLVLPAGQYEVELKSKGYRDWKHKVNLEGSSIEQLVYPVLFPSTLVSNNLKDLAIKPSMITQSPDRRWLIMHVGPAANTFNIVDLDNNKHPTTAITLPSDTLTASEGLHSYEAVEWSSDNNNLLLKHKFSTGTEFILLKRDAPAESINMNKFLSSQPFTSISMRDKKADQFYLLNSPDGKLYTADIRTKTPLLVSSGVISYKSYQADTLLYVTNVTGDPSTVEVHLRHNDKDNLLRTLPLASDYLLNMARFNGILYVATGSVADTRTYVYKDPLRAYNNSPPRSPLPFRVLVVPNSQYVSFSSTSRFIAVQGGSNFAVYDIETSRQFRYDINLPLATPQKASWMDGHRLVLNSGGNINIFDFDGTNLQTLGAALPDFVPSFNPDFSAMFSLRSNGDRSVLIRTELKAVPISSAQ